MLATFSVPNLFLLWPQPEVCEPYLKYNQAQRLLWRINFTWYPFLNDQETSESIVFPSIFLTTFDTVAIYMVEAPELEETTGHYRGFES